MQYAKETEYQTLRYPNAAEFPGIPNWEEHDVALRAKDYMPLVGEPDYRPGYEAEPATWHTVYQSEEHETSGPDGEETDPETGAPVPGVRRTYTVDTSYIQVDTWEYIPIPEPEPPVVRYSRYLIKRACERRGLWEQVKAAIEAAGKWESFLIINDIASDNQELEEAMPLIVQTFGQALVDEVLAESIVE